MNVLIAEDDNDDYMLIQDCLAGSPVLFATARVKDGEELMDYLLRRGGFAEAPRPGLILLDLNMPRKDGREALKEIKSHPELKRIPVVVLTTSKADEDVHRTYELGVNSYVQKPLSFERFMRVIETVRTYWLETVRLPAR